MVGFLDYGGLLSKGDSWQKRGFFRTYLGVHTKWDQQFLMLPIYRTAGRILVLLLWLDSDTSPTPFPLTIVQLLYDTVISLIHKILYTIPETGFIGHVSLRYGRYLLTLLVTFSLTCSMCKSSISRLTWFPLLIRFNWIESYHSTQLVLSGDLNTWSLIPHSLFLLIIYTLMFFPSTPLGRWWNTLPIIFQ